ncbi:MAG: M56 family metallopeptidase, partial [Bacteroidota bacterium]
MDFLNHQLLTAIGATVLHAFWQATLLAIFLWAIARYFNPIPTTRYRLAYGALLLQLALSAITLGYSFDLPEVQTVSTSSEEIPLLIVKAPVDDGTAVVTAPLPEEGIFMPELYLALAGIWFLGLLFGGLQLLAGHWQTTYRYRRHLLALPKEWLNIADHLLERLNYRGKIPQLALSSRIFSPALVGVFRPLILLPVAMVNQLSLEQVEAVLAHEMAHLRRADHWWNLLQSIIELLFYFNPAVHWISRCIREEREHCCDDIVASLGIDPVIYAKTLFQLETQRQLSPGLALAARPGSLLGRIERLLLNTPNQYRMKPGMLLFLLLLVSTLFSLNSPTPVTSSPNHPEERMVPVTEAEVSVNGLIKK